MGNRSKSESQIPVRFRPLAGDWISSQYRFQSADGRQSYDGTQRSGGRVLPGRSASIFMSRSWKSCSAHRSNPPTGTLVTVSPGWWSGNFPNLTSSNTPAIETANGTAVGFASISLAATHQMGFGIDPANSVVTALDLTGTNGTGMLQGFQFMAQTLRDECTAAEAQSVASQITLTSKGFRATLAGTGNFDNDASADPTLSPGVGQTTGAAGNLQALVGNAGADPTSSILLATVGSLQNVNVVDQVSASSLGSPYVGNATPGYWTDYLASRYEYRDHSQSNKTKCNGTVVMPATVLGVPPVRCQTRNAVYYLDCAYEVERIGGAPEVPVAQDYPNWLLLNSRCNKPNLDISADGVTLVYRAGGQIEWMWTGTDSSGNYTDPSVDYPIPPWLAIDYSALPDLIPDIDENLKNANPSTEALVGEGV